MASEQDCSRSGEPREGLRARARVSTSLAAPQVKAAAVSGYKRPPLVWFFYCSEDLLLGRMHRVALSQLISYFLYFFKCFCF